jgi:DNA-directed RNA polymerase specialized sigma24 family protein
MTLKSLKLDEHSLPWLEAKCRHETETFRRGERSDGRFCLEIIRRALARGAIAGSDQLEWEDREAQAVFIRIYSEFIKAQINRSALYGASLDELVQDVWLRFWRAVAGKGEEGLDFSTLGKALSYLQRTTASAVLTHRRYWRDAQRRVSLEELVDTAGDARLPDSSADVPSKIERRRFNERVRELLNDVEYQVFALRYHGQLAPRAITALLSERGRTINGLTPSKARSVSDLSTARSVSDLLERIKKRLAEDPEIRDLLQAD